jgi:hypothetical protein
MKKLLLALTIALVPSLAWAQGAVLQNGPVTKFDLPGWIQDKTIMSGTKMFTDNHRGFNLSHFFDNHGPGVCSEDALTSGGYHQICIGHDASGNGVLSLNAGNGAANSLFRLDINGTTYDFPGTGSGNVVGPTPTVVGHLVAWNNTAGTLTKDFAGMMAASGVTGGSDNTAGFQSQTNAAQAIGGGLLMLGQGQWGLTGGVTSGADTAWLVLPGGYLSGSAYFDWEVDSTLLNSSNSSTITFGKLLSKAGTATPSSANQQGLVIQAVGPVTNSLASYQKDGFVSTVRQLDPSVYGGSPIIRDLSAIEGQARLSVNNGRVWAQHGLTVVESGIQGLGFGAEFEITNLSGLDADTHLDSATAQYVLHIDSIGSNKVTAGIVIDALGAGKMYDGLISKTTVGTKHFIGLVSDVVTDARPFAVDWTGNLFARSFQFTASGVTRGPVMVSDSTLSTLEFQSSPGQTVYHTIANTGTGANTGSSLILSTGLANSTLTANINESLLQATIITGAGLTAGMNINTPLLQFGGAGNWAANGGVATALSSVGPVGSHTTVQKWFKVYDNLGVPLFIPAF